VAITRLKTSSIIEGFPKSKSILTGNDAIFAGSYESIATITVGSGGQASAEFTSIPSTYTHLEVRFASANATGSNRIRMQINSDTGSNYSTHLLLGDGSSAASVAGANTDKIAVGAATGGTTSVFAVGVVSILDYANTNKYKTIRSLSGLDNNGTGEVDLNSGSWRNTAAVTSLKLFWDTGNAAQYSSFALYGIN
jgi:hypothetical protein